MYRAVIPSARLRARPQPGQHYAVSDKVLMDDSTASNQSWDIHQPVEDSIESTVFFRQ